MTPLRTIFSSFILLAAIPVAGQQVDSTAVLEENITPYGKTESEAPEHNTGLELEIGQLIIDDTFSKIGGDFQQLFNTRWAWPTKNADQFILTISERPSFVNSTVVEISINELKVYESFLQPRYDVLEETVDQAIDITLQYILNYEDVVKELSGEDLVGSGIY